MRCNLILCQFLTDQHLNAERRELRMIPPLLAKRVKSGKHTTADIPRRYTLGSGHMLFWLDKFLYLEKRYIGLTDEMVRRGFNPNLEFFLDVSLAKQHNAYNDWVPELEDYDIIATRLRERIEQKFNWYKYCSQPITRDWFTVTYPIPYYSEVS
jgi:deoxyribonuclease (pyrimidine dimer)